MKVLGISGIEGTVDFKRRHWPGLDEREYRISQGHDSAAALVIDGEFIAGVAEERLSRKKHTGAFPTLAIQSCLDQAGIGASDLDEVVHGFDFGPYQTLYRLDPVSAELFDELLSPSVFTDRVMHALPALGGGWVGGVDHHLAHAASAYYTSGWSDCLVIVVDGMGEAHGASVYLATDGRLEPIYRIAASSSIGIFYSVVTLHVGFEFNSDEYKVMGLAPYGDPGRFASFFDDAVRLRADGGWDIPALRLGRNRDDRENHRALRDRLSSELIPAREPEGEIATEHEDVAAALQRTLDRAMLHLCAHFGSKTGRSRLALAGGVALNTTANAKLMKAGLFDEIYVQPAAADDGTALGAALLRAAAAGEVVNRRSPTPFYGPAPSTGQITNALRDFAKSIEYEDLGSLTAACLAAAALIADGQVIAWYRGRMEFGPRALGHRSIIADPGRPQMRDRVNALVKLREAFRPFAPAVSLRQASRWFDIPEGLELPYMNANVNVREEFRGDLPATTHVDGSARVQTVSAEDDPDFFALLEAVGQRTGREIVLNTSFNVRGQPIVNTPAEAVETFLGTGIDVLFLGDILVRPTPGTEAALSPRSCGLERVPTARVRAEPSRR
jgi:carbamoyltransferase